MTHGKSLSFYLAARYSRRKELVEYREQLQALGHRVTSIWLNGGHQIDEAGVPIGEDGEQLFESGIDDPHAVKLREFFAQEDLNDIEFADVLIAFTEPPRSTTSRGGRHVEMGYALGRYKPVIVVGPQENVFCYLPQVSVYSTWDEALSEIHSALGTQQGVEHGSSQ